MSTATAESESENNKSENDGMGEEEISGVVNQRRSGRKRTGKKTGGGDFEAATSRSKRSGERKQTRKRRRLETEPVDTIGDSSDNEVKNGSSDGTPNNQNEHVSLPPLLFQPDSIPVKGRINSYSKTKYILDIVKVLEGTWEYDWLRKSCFGKLFDLPFRKCALSGKLVHQILCRMLVTKKLHEMWFVFGGYPIRFSLREFVQLTGLNCQPYPVDLENRRGQQAAVRKGTYWRELLGPKQAYTIVDIVNMLKSDKRLPVEERMTSGRRLRLALLVIVEGVLINSSSAVQASRRVVEMVRDVDKFVQYPWGRESFERTIEMVTLGAKNPSSKILVGKLQKSHTITHGFTLAFQLLVLQAVPMLESLLPDEGEGTTLGNSVLDDVPQLKSFRSSNIVEVEHDPDLLVESIIGVADDMDSSLFEWDDEVEDTSIEYICAALESGQTCRQEDWGPVHDHQAKGGDKDLNFEEMMKECEVRGKRKRSSAPVAEEAQSFGVETLDVESQDGERCELSMKTEILREVKRLQNEQTLRMELFLKDHIAKLKDEIFRKVMDEIQKVVGLTKGGLEGPDNKGKYVVAKDKHRGDF